MSPRRRTHRSERWYGVARRSAQSFGKSISASTQVDASPDGPVRILALEDHRSGLTLRASCIHPARSELAEGLES